jgi:hypothetical protein
VMIIEWMAILGILLTCIPSVDIHAARALLQAGVLRSR